MLSGMRRSGRTCNEDFEACQLVHNTSASALGHENPLADILAWDIGSPEYQYCAGHFDKNGFRVKVKTITLVSCIFF